MIIASPCPANMIARHEFVRQLLDPIPVTPQCLVPTDQKTRPVTEEAVIGSSSGA